MAEDTEITAGGQDGAGQGSPSLSTSVAAPETPVTDKLASQTSEPGSAKPVDPTRDVYDKLLAEVEARTTPPTSPSTPASTAKSEELEDESGFIDLKPDSLDALKRTHRMPSPDVWAHMEPLAKATLVHQAKSELSRKEREFQESKRTAEAGKKNGEGNKSDAAPATVDDLDAAFEPFIQRFEELQLGDEGKALRDAVVSQLRPIRAQAAHRDKAIEFVLSRMWNTERGSAYKVLDEEYKQASSWTQESKTKTDTLAQALFQAQWDAGNTDYDIGQATLDAAHSIMHKYVKQNVQQQLADSRRRSLRGTPESPASVPQSPKPMTREQILRQRFDAFVAKGGSANPNALREVQAEIPE